MKQLVTNLLELQAKRLLKKFKPKVVAVVGSVGKTSTKLNIATVLSERYKVLAHYGSYNVPASVPLSMFNLKAPANAKSPFAWIKILSQMQKILSSDYSFDVLVLELGTDHPGEIAYFKRYLNPDVSVVTAVSPEHMAGFGTLDAVAKEELAVTEYSKLTLINRDDIDGSFAKLIPDGTNLDTYGTSGVAEYRFETDEFVPGKGFTGKFISPEFKELKVVLGVVGEHNVRTVVAAGTVGIKLGLSAEQVVDGMKKVKPVMGRMNLLKGLENTTIIDDTYNSSPLAAVAALQTLYQFQTPQRIAILGSMNELGDYSKQAHEEVASACDPASLDWVVTIGQEAKTYMTPILQKKGCRVENFTSPYDAGNFVHKIMQPKAVILAKGSQNGVFAEEAVKMLLHSTTEEEQLVRQDPDWMAIKQQQFGEK
ncbi:MAG TPA: UDP-N-acetylmuramoyl-tripeptide--D-alanyl-D-alanine ligase [Candidatus Saccharimonadales bacterium]|nr:UDP-N-acetylmuramoyl-tripeptide--D-alanyl-D-alanine ligase [Candidatus Saccharimonadales bacterium]